MRSTSRLMFPRQPPDRSPAARWESEPGSAASAGGRAEQPPCCLEPRGLGWTASPWIPSPPTRAIPTTRGAPGDPTGTGKPKHASLIIYLCVSGLNCLMWNILFSACSVAKPAFMNVLSIKWASFLFSHNSIWFIYCCFWVEKVQRLKKKIFIFFLPESFPHKSGVR